MDLSDIEWEEVDWMHLCQERDQWRALMNTVMKFLAQQWVENFLAKWMNNCFLKMTLLRGVG
jgi:hypothetical protein